MTPALSTSFTVATDGGELCVWESGPADGPVVIALHGITAHGRSFRGLAGALAGHRVIAPDLRGRGGSRHVTGPFSMAAHADDVARIAEVAGVERATVLGHSMGGFAALVTAHRQPDLVERLVLVDGGLPLELPEAILSLPTDELVGMIIGPALARLQMTFGSHDAYRDMWRQHPALAADWNPLIEAYIDDDLVGTAPELRPGAVEEAVLRDGESELVHDDVARAIDTLAVSTTLVAAEFGLLAADAPPLYADDQLDAFARAHAGARVVRVPGVNHYTILLTDRGVQAVASEVTTP